MARSCVSLSCSLIVSILPSITSVVNSILPVDEPTSFLNMLLTLRWWVSMGDMWTDESRRWIESIEPSPRAPRILLICGRKGTGLSSTVEFRFEIKRVLDSALVKMLLLPPCKLLTDDASGERN